MTDLDSKFAALSDPTRRAILARLLDGPAPAGTLAEPFDITPPAVSRHLKVLEQAGLITRTVQGQQRICALAPGALDGVEDYLGPLRAALAANYARLDALLDTLQNRKT
ncbi:MAG: winged helix-turn-helix transcriptional regulator [Roseivivax sp.]|nr:winged helix-turn-helix transcriptional regulator [Roseivivax sp.]